MSRPLQLLAVEVRTEQDVVLARQRARQLARLLGFDLQGQTRIGTAASEIVRNAFRYAGPSRVTFAFGQSPQRRFIITVSDSGPGIAHLDDVLAGRYVSQTGMGMGLLGTRRIMDRVEIDSAPGRGTTVTMTKFLPQRTPPLGSADFARIATTLAQGVPGDPLGEVQQQNQELLAVLGELNQRQSELVAVNKELEDTNRGVVALYAELDARADFLRRTTEVKSRFLSNMTHEFRTPLNSIIALAHMLLDRTDGELAAEQERQAGFILKSAQDLSTLVNDLLDIAKVETGKVAVRPAPFAVGDLFGALKGMLRPLLSPHGAVVLDFVEPEPGLSLVSDEGKVSQVLRNLISNALKFTERGSVRVAVAREGDGVVFTVADTGIGIKPEHMAVIFEEFGQVETGVQQRFQGSGLGLPLSKLLAGMLGGQLEVSSAPGLGSTFRFSLPMRYAGAVSGDLIAGAPAAGEQATRQRGGAAEAPRVARQVLVIDDDEVSRYLIRGLLPRTFEVSEVSHGGDALSAAARLMPDAVLLNLHFSGAGAPVILHQLKGDAAVGAIPVVAYSPQIVDEALLRECVLADDMLVVGPDARTSVAAMRGVLERIGLGTGGRRGDP